MRHKLEDLALRAGERILKFYEQLDPLEVDHKRDGSPVTAADMAAHKILTSGLETLSTLPVVSEEDGVKRLHGATLEDYWLIDPLDGTKDFLKKSAMFTVNIALIHKDQPVAGVVYAPALDELYSAWDDKVYFNRQPLQRRQRTREEPIRALTSALHPSAEVEEFLKENSIQQVKRVGSSLKFCHIAAGLADVYPRMSPTAEWDTAAGQAIAEAAGCVVVDLEHLHRLRYSKTDIINPWFIVFQPGEISPLRWRGKTLSLQ
ncbi:MAG: 3'(2'),5'-bisphosphate nucleotidase CysQ [Oligoflexus sp.]